jgi:hypothetical protein
VVVMRMVAESRNGRRGGQGESFVGAQGMGGS